VRGGESARGCQAATPTSCCVAGDVVQGTYDRATNTGGPNGSVRFKELGHAANKGLEIALRLIKEVQEKHPKMSVADLFQLGGVCAVEFAGGPRIPFRQGRKDVTEAEAVEEGRLPDAKRGAPHLRDILYVHPVWERVGWGGQGVIGGVCVAARRLCGHTPSSVLLALAPQ
jgi:hypothetical protein